MPVHQIRIWMIFVCTITLNANLCLATGTPNGAQNDPAAVLASGGAVGKGLTEGGAVTQDVDLYTGGVSFSLPLVSNTGRAGLDVAVGLRYNSHVATTAWSPNYESQASWVGIGWDMSFGSIISDHKNTRFYSDDEYYLKTEDGQTSKLIPKAPTSDTFYTQDYKFWRIVRVLGDQGSLSHVRGWRVYREDGTVYEYGDLSDASFGFTLANRNATRYRICWGDFSGIGTAFGSGFTGKDSVFEVAWDLSASRTIKTGGQVMRFTYEQESASLSKSPTDTSTYRYTRASYPKQVLLPNGRTIQFVLASRTDYAARFGDGLHQELYETKKLSEIRVTDKNGAIYQRVQLGQTTYGTAPYNKMVLSFLRSCDSLTNCLPDHAFSYVTATGATDNYLALSEIEYPSGGSVKYTYADFSDAAYESRNFSKLDVTFPADSVSLPGWGSEGVAGAVQGYGSATQTDVYPKVWNGYWQTLPDGSNIGRGAYFSDFSINQGLLAYANLQNGQVIARTNRGGVWDSVPVFQAGGFTAGTDWISTAVGPDYVTILVSKEIVDSVMFVICKRDFITGANGWRVDTLLKANWDMWAQNDYTENQDYKALDFAAYPDFFSMIFETQSPEKNRCLAAQWTGTGWSMVVDTLGQSHQRRWAAGRGYMAIMSSGSGGNYHAWLNFYRWEKNAWDSLSDSEIDTLGLKLWYPQGAEDYFIVGAEKSDEKPCVYAFAYNGQKWTATDLGRYLDNDLDRDSRCYGINSDGVVIAKSLDPGLFFERDVQLWKWTGSGWTLAQTIQHLDETQWMARVAVGNDVIGIYRRGEESGDQGTELYLSYRGSSAWSTPTQVTAGHKIGVARAGNSYVAISDESTLLSGNDEGNVYWWNGTSWQSSGTGSLIYDPDESVYGNNFFSSRTAVTWECCSNSRALAYKFQSQQRNLAFSGPAEYFPVIRKVLFDGLRDPDGDTTLYDYDYGILDGASRSPRFARVAVRGPYRGSTQPADDLTVTWFYNDLDAALNQSGDSLPNLDGNDGYVLDGRPYSIRVEKATSTGSGNCDRDSVNMTYSVVHPKPGTSLILPVTTVSASDCVIDTTSYQYPDQSGTNANGLPHSVLRYGSKRNGVRPIVISRTSFAHEVSSVLRDSNVISLPWATIAAESTTSAPTVLSRSNIYYATGALGSGWEFFPPTSGLAYRSISPADTFKTADSVTTIDGYNISQSMDPYGTVTSSRMGFDSSLVIATAANCRQREWAIWDFEEPYDGTVTCGLPEFQPGTGSSLVTVPDSVFSGRTSGRVTASSGGLSWGPIGAVYGNDCSYSIVADTLIFDGWVRYSGGSNECYIKAVTDSSNVIRTDSVFHSGNGQWEHLTLFLRSVGEIDVISVALYLDAPPSTTKTAYADDFRLAPAHAQLTSRTFDPKTWQVLSTSGPENIPIKHKYDSYGRMIESRNHKNELLEVREYFVSSFPNYVESVVYRSSSDSTVSRLYTDGLGRPVQSRAASFDGDSTYVVVVTEYDEKGRPYKTWKPFYQPSLAYSSTATTACASYYDGTPGPNCGSYAYSQALFHTDPLGRSYKGGAPGTSFHLTSGHVPVSTFGHNVSSDSAGFAEQELRKSTITDEDGQTVKRFSDKLGRAVCTVRGSGASTIRDSAFYDALGRVVSTVDPRGLTSTFGYNALGQRTSEKSPDAGWHRMLYDKLGRLRLEKDSAFSAQGSFVYYKYDALGRRTEWGRVTDISSFTQSNADAPAFPTSNFVKEYTNIYDGPAGGGINANGKLVRTSDRLGTIWRSSVYDAFGRLQAETVYVSPLAAKTLKYQYNRLGMMTHEVNVDGVSVEHLYDRAGRLYQVKDSASVLAEFTYWPMGAISTAKYKKDGTATTIQTVDYVYNPRDWLLRVNDRSSLDSTESADRFALRLRYEDTADVNGVLHFNGMVSQISTWRQGLSPAPPDSVIHRYGFDGLGRLSRDSIKTSSEEEILQYDRNGNVTYRQVGDLTSTFCYESTSNHLTSMGISCPGSTTYTYDLNGQLKERGASDLTFSWRNLLGAYEVPHGTIPNMLYFEYDPLRQRVKTNYHYWYCDYSDCNVELSAGQGGDSLFEGAALSLPGGGGAEADAGGGGGPCLYECADQVWVDNLTYFIFDQFGQVVAEYDGSTLARKYYYAGGARFAMRDKANGSKLYYMLGDQVASSRAVIQATNDSNAGKLVSAYDFYPYGQTLDADVSVDPKYQFGGHRYHSDGGINISYLGARFYDAASMRFISMDPAGQFFSPYTYGGGNPLLGVDPNGEAFWFLVPIIIGAASGGAMAEIGGGNFWEGAALGAISGAAFSFGTGVLGHSILSNAFGNVGSYSLTSAISGDQITFRGLLSAGVVGAVGGLVPESPHVGKNLWANAGSELGANATRGYMQGALGAAISGGDPRRGALMGALGGAITTGLQLTAFGPYRELDTDEQAAYDDIASSNGGSYLPRIRNGLLFSGVSFLGNVVAPEHGGQMPHEMDHFLSGTAKMGGGRFGTRYVYDRWIRPRVYKWLGIRQGVTAAMPYVGPHPTVGTTWWLTQDLNADAYARNWFSYDGYKYHYETHK